MEDIWFSIGNVLGLVCAVVLIIASGWVIASVICRHSSLGRSGIGKMAAVVVAGTIALLGSLVFLHIPLGIFGLIDLCVEKVLSV